MGTILKWMVTTFKLKVTPSKWMTTPFKWMVNTFKWSLFGGRLHILIILSPSTIASPSDSIFDRAKDVFTYSFSEYA